MKKARAHVIEIVADPELRAKERAATKAAEKVFSRVRSGHAVSHGGRQGRLPAQREPGGRRSQAARRSVPRRHGGPGREARPAYRGEDGSGQAPPACRGLLCAQEGGSGLECLDVTDGGRDPSLALAAQAGLTTTHRLRTRRRSGPLRSTAVGTPGTPGTAPGPRCGR